jgi:hypothetical protein
MRKFDLGEDFLKAEDGSTDLPQQQQQQQQQQPQKPKGSFSKLYSVSELINEFVLVFVISQSRFCHLSKQKSSWSRM